MVFIQFKFKKLAKKDKEKHKKQNSLIKKKKTYVNKPTLPLLKQKLEPTYCLIASNLKNK